MESELLYKMVSGAIWRAGFMKDGNRVKQQAKKDTLKLVACNFIGVFKNNKSFNEKEFLKACGLK